MQQSNSSPFSRRQTALAASLLALGIVSAACGGISDSKSVNKRTAANRSAPAVTIDTFAFSPGVVRVHVGDEVTWTNHDDILHTVTSGTREYAPGNGGQVTAIHKDGLIDKQLDGRRSTAAFTFTRSGRYHYFCDRHPGMEADVEVS